MIFHCVNIWQFSLHSSADGHLSYFHIFTAVNSAAVTLHEQVFSSVSVLVSLGYRPRRGAVGSWGNLRAMEPTLDCDVCTTAMHVRSYSTPLGFHSPLVAENLPWQCYETWSRSCSGRVHMPQQLPARPQLTGPTHPRAHVPQQRFPPHCRRSSATAAGSSATRPQNLEKSPHASNEDPASAINKQINIS